MSLCTYTYVQSTPGTSIKSVFILQLIVNRLGGYPPFSDELTNFSLHDQICQARYSFPDKYWGSVSDEGKDLIKRLLTIDPKQRISTTEALEHPWMQDEEVVGKAKKIMETAARNLEEMAPPSGMPVSL